MSDFLNTVEVEKAILDNKNKLTAGWVYAADCLHWKEFPNYMHYTKSDLTEAHNDISFDVSFRGQSNFIRNKTLIEQHQRIMLWPKVTNKTTINFPKGDMTNTKSFLEMTLTHSATQVEFQYTPSVSLGKRISLDWDIWVLMADSEYNHDETKLWLEKLNSSVFHSDQFGPSIDVIYVIGNTTHVIPAAVGETTLHDTHGVPICLWLVDTDYNPKMRVGGQAGTAPEFFSAIHKQIAKLTNDVAKLQPLTALTATQIEFIQKI